MANDGKSGRGGHDLQPKTQDGRPQRVSSGGDISAFVQMARDAGAARGGKGRGRLIFAMDATMSRQPTWDRACHHQAEMFDEAARLGGLDVQLVYFRGHGECGASKWVSDPSSLGALMSKIACRGGLTQIGKVLGHAITASAQQRVGAVVYVGDAMEENPDLLCAKAGELALRGTPVFIFHEGGAADAAATFREIARITKGAYMAFDSGSAAALASLLRAVAAYAGGGLTALADLSGTGNREATRLLTQLRN